MRDVFPVTWPPGPAPPSPRREASCEAQILQEAEDFHGGKSHVLPPHLVKTLLKGGYPRLPLMNVIIPRSQTRHFPAY